jgi:hypothetical protein
MPTSGKFGGEIMQTKSKLLHRCAVFAVLLVSSLISYSQVKGQPLAFLPYPNSLIASNSVNIANLVDGDYQFCSQTDPKDWRDGVGVCLNFHKNGNSIDGYYGYPHSDHFICLRGNVERNIIAGEALEIMWGGNQHHQIPQSAFQWDLEGRLTLNKGKTMSTLVQGEDVTETILYRSAVLNLEGFHQYTRPRMTPPSQLCAWQLT